jgi:hypothetical protein
MKMIRVLLIVFLVTIIGVTPFGDAAAWPTLCQASLVAYQSALADVGACFADHDLPADWCAAAQVRLARATQWIEMNCAYSQ